MTFVRNHAKAIIASDFFVVVTATFQLVCVVVIMERMTPEPPWKSFLRRTAVITESKVNGIRRDAPRAH